MKNVIVWGMGGYYQKRKDWISLKEYNILAFIHGDPKFSGTFFEGKRVILPEEVNEYNYDFIVLAVENEERFVKKLINIGVPLEKIKPFFFTSDMIYKGAEALPLCRPKIRTIFNSYPNIGDILNAFMLDKLFRIKVVKTNILDADLIAIGSILDSLLVNKEELLEMDVKSVVHIWGTGLMYECVEKKKFLRPVNVHSLRGRLTKERVSYMLGYDVDSVLADPGLLASLIYECNEKKYRLGIIPHYIESNEKIFNDLLKYYENAIIIDVRNHPMKVLQQISQCECIISTSLHGLIIADSYGIPNQWCIYSDKILGNGYKYRDYYSAFDLEKEPYILKENVFPDIDDIINGYSISKESVKKKQKELLECFPKFI